MNLRFKILSGFLILAVMLFAAGLVSIAELNRIRYSVRGLLEENYISIVAARDMRDALEEQHSGILMLALKDREDGWQSLEKAHGDFQQAFARARENITLPGERESVDAVETAYLLFRASWSNFEAGSRGRDKKLLYLEEVYPSLQNVTTAVNHLMTLNGNALHDTAVGLQNQAGRTIMPGIVAIIAAIVFTLVFNFFINLYVIAPIRRLTRAVTSHVRDGEPMIIRTESRDEISRLAEAIQELVLYGGPKNSRKSS
ncbi:MAG: MCP four helix bundle domain-containing protein [Thermodesulfobacteriota bacterium]